MLIGHRGMLYRWTRTGLVAAIACVLMSVLCAGARAEEGCPNKALRTGLSASLPDCRAYEMATPPYKEGAPVGIVSAVAPDGSRVIVKSLGNLGDAGGEPDNAGSTYELTRTATGWSETGIDLPQAQFPDDQFLGASEDLNKTSWFARASSQPCVDSSFYIRDADGSLHDLGPTTNPEGAQGEPPCIGIPTQKVSQFQAVNYGASRDLSHVIFGVPARREKEEEEQKPRLWKGDKTARDLISLYEYTVGMEGAEPRLVGVENEGLLDGSPHINEGAVLASECGIDLGTISHLSGAGVAEGAVSENGATVFFTALAATEGPGNDHCTRAGEGSGPPVNELDARIGDEKTLRISSPSHPLVQGKGPGPEECDPACEAAALQAGAFQGASRDGSKVFFLTNQPLLNGDEGGTGTGRDLYEAEIEGAGRSAKVARFVQVSHDPNPGQAAEVQGVTRISDDGSHVYFVAKGELADNSNGQAAPFSTAHEGAENLYVHELDPANPGQTKTVFVAMLCSGEGESGSVSDSECHSSDDRMWGLDAGALVEGHAPAQSTPDGRFLVFSSATDLTAPEDTSTVSQVFRYDAQAGELLRVSAGQRSPAGYLCPVTGRLENFNCNGNTDTFAVVVAQPKPGAPVAISGDGSYVVFQSADGLTPGALNGQVESYNVLRAEVESQQSYFANNVYEYHDGEVSLISDGLDTSATSGTGQGAQSSVQLNGMASSGADVFFATADRLVPQDTDTQQDVYDARIGGGFPPPPVFAPCREEACQGPPGSPPLFGTPSSATFSGVGNLMPPASISAVAKPKPVKCKKGFVKRHNARCVKKPFKSKKARKSSRDRRARR